MPRKIEDFNYKLSYFFAALALIGCLAAQTALFSKPHPTGTNHAEKKITCAKCGKPLTSKYIQADGLVFHPGCFVCAKCKKVIHGKYHVLNREYYHPLCYKKRVGLFCAKCGKPIEGSWIVYNGKKYHSQCTPLRCTICGKALSGEYFSDKGGKYHKSCYLQHKALVCSVCKQPIISGKYVTDVWGNRSHEFHNNEKIQTCDYCSRVISSATSDGGYRYDDGRIVCGICKRSIVDDNEEAAGCLPGVLKILSASPASFIDIPRDIPIQLVDRFTLNRLKGGKSTGQDQGLTKSSVIYEGKRVIRTEHRIYILVGIPRLEFEAVLAHELLHVWLIKNNIDLPGKEKEGFCNLGCALVYRADGSKLGKVLLNKMKDNPDPVYGKGYRMMNERLQDLGWKTLKKSIMKR